MMIVQVPPVLQRIFRMFRRPPHVLLAWIDANCAARCLAQIISLREPRLVRMKYSCATRAGQVAVGEATALLPQHWLTGHNNRETRQTMKSRCLMPYVCAAGTFIYAAPEMLLGSYGLGSADTMDGGASKCSPKVDIYSFGVVLWEIVTREVISANCNGTICAAAEC